MGSPEWHDGSWCWRVVRGTVGLLVGDRRSDGWRGAVGRANGAGERLVAVSRACGQTERKIGMTLPGLASLGSEIAYLPVIMVGVATGLLFAAAWHDLRTRLIPDGICIILAVLGIIFRFRLGWYDFAFSAITALLFFFMLFIAFTRGVIGGGDVKLASAVALWLSPPECYVFVVATTLVGGVLAMFHLLLRSLLSLNILRVGNDGMAGAELGGAPSRFVPAELARIKSGAPLPYGVALAAGGCYVLLRSLGG